MKYTAKNDEFLKAVKGVVNIKIYKQALSIYNEQGKEKNHRIFKSIF